MNECVGHLMLYLVQSVSNYFFLSGVIAVNITPRSVVQLIFSSAQWLVIMPGEG